MIVMPDLILPGHGLRTHLKNSLRAHGGVMQRLKMITTKLYAAHFRRCMPCPEP